MARRHLPAASPNNFGYDHFFGYTGGGTSYYPLPPGDPRPDEIIADGSPVGWNGYLTDVLGDEAVRWIGADRSKPFFLSLHFSAAHFPWTPPDDPASALAWTDAFDRNRGKRGDLRQDRRLARRQRRQGARRGRSVRVRPNTIVVFTSDNGGERFSEMWPFTGAKGELLEGGIRVPLIVHWPGRIAAGAVSDQVMSRWTSCRRCSPRPRARRRRAIRRTG